MNLSKELKKKRDAEDRLRNRSPVTVFSETTTGEQSFKGTDDFALKNHNHDDLYVKKGEVMQVKYYEPITNGNIEMPELLFYEGDLIIGEVI